jgi:hypothetical protein
MAGTLAGLIGVWRLVDALRRDFTVMQRAL